jgi:hypothetical protein
VGNPGTPSEGVPGQALRFPRLANLGGKPGRRFLAAEAIGGREFLRDRFPDGRVTLALFRRRRALDALEWLVCHETILCLN